MKLLFCVKCQDVVKINKRYRACACGVSCGAYYADGVSTVIAGPALVLGFSDAAMAEACLGSAGSKGVPFEAHALPIDAATVTRVDKGNIEQMLHDLPESFTKDDADRLIVAANNSLEFKAPPAPESKLKARAKGKSV